MCAHTGNPNSICGPCRDNTRRQLEEQRKRDRDQRERDRKKDSGGGGRGTKGWW